MNYAFDEYMMRECLALASNAIGMTSPNPLVGSVIVRDHKIIGRGYHKKSGMPHAEVEAIKDANGIVEGATLYCNLEPCCHVNKRTPPCAQLIVEKKIKKVVIGMLDPNPEVAGKGIELLRANGIEVTTGVLENDCKELNRVFVKQMNTKLPFVHVKWAQTINGVMANENERLLISNQEALRFGHELRLSYDAILIGRQTLNSDDPKLSIRHIPNANNKVLKKVIVGDFEKMKKESHLLANDFENVIVVTKENNILKDHKQFLGYETFNWKNILESLRANFNIQSILIEGGVKTIESLLEEDCIDMISILTSPKVFEGRGIKTDSLLKLNEFKDVKTSKLGDNFLTEYRR